ncbi:apiosidase-like domain-containing protein [Lunatibacter salilacus]|uniref:apiosidase-like domain-containing protein n=1 Tax=Lunatibacter salilacus TaxID=2483804 RepID=UPI00131CC9BC|nr:DUF4038 domain-containing protein [Lunatibacter salilacus]
MLPTSLPNLKISPDNRYLLTENGTPFFWLGDTAWELIHRLDKEESLHYLQDRADKGFNVVQAVILAELDGLTDPNALGDLPLIEQDPLKPNESYFTYVDFLVDEAAKRGIYMGLLPTWGDKYNKAWGVGPEVFTPENAFAYGEYLGRRYSDVSNIIWIMGGDRLPANTEDYQIVCQMSLGIRRGGAKQLMTMHPKGGNIASGIYGKESWLEVDMFQSYHMKGCREYRFTKRALAAVPKRPVIDGEPGYENIPNFLNKIHRNRLDAYDVRRAAYWNMLSGAAGHTYGCNEIWQMFRPGKTPLHGAEMPWFQAMDLPGSRQMGYMKSFFDRLPWQRLRSAPEFLGGFNWKTAGYIVAMVDGHRKFALTYSPAGRRIRANLQLLESREIVAFWFEPATNKITAVSEKIEPRLTTFKPRNLTAESPDRLLLVIDKSLFAALDIEF